MTHDDLNQVPWDATTRPAPEVVEEVRAAIQRQLSRQERNARHIEHCLRLLREGETGDA